MIFYFSKMYYIALKFLKEMFTFLMYKDFNAAVQIALTFLKFKISHKMPDILI